MRAEKTDRDTMAFIHAELIYLEGVSITLEWMNLSAPGIHLTPFATTFRSLAAARNKSSNAKLFILKVDIEIVSIKSLKSRPQLFLICERAFAIDKSPLCAKVPVLN